MWNGLVVSECAIYEYTCTRAATYSGIAGNVSLFIYSLLYPVNPFAIWSSVRGPMDVPTIKSIIAPTMTAIRKFCAFDSHSMPTPQMITKISTVMTPTIRTSLLPPSMICTSYVDNKSLSELQKPIVFMLAETALANANTTPTDAPNSGPNDLEMM